MFAHISQIPLNLVIDMLQYFLSNNDRKQWKIDGYIIPVGTAFYPQNGEKLL